MHDFCEQFAKSNLKHFKDGTLADSVLNIMWSQQDRKFSARATLSFVHDAHIFEFSLHRSLCSRLLPDLNKNLLTWRNLSLPLSRHPQA